MPAEAKSLNSTKTEYLKYYAMFAHLKLNGEEWYTTIEGTIKDTEKMLEAMYRSEFVKDYSDKKNAKLRISSDGLNLIVSDKKFGEHLKLCGTKAQRNTTRIYMEDRGDTIYIPLDNQETRKDGEYNIRRYYHDTCNRKKFNGGKVVPLAGEGFFLLPLPGMTREQFFEYIRVNLGIEFTLNKEDIVPNEWKKSKNVKQPKRRKSTDSHTENTPPKNKRATKRQKKEEEPATDISEQKVVPIDLKSQPMQVVEATVPAHAAPQPVSVPIIEQPAAMQAVQVTAPAQPRPMELTQAPVSASQRNLDVSFVPAAQPQPTAVPSFFFAPATLPLSLFFARMPQVPAAAISVMLTTPPRSLQSAMTQPFSEEGLRRDAPFHSLFFPPKPTQVLPPAKPSTPAPTNPGK